MKYLLVLVYLLPSGDTFERRVGWSLDNKTKEMTHEECVSMKEIYDESNAAHVKKKKKAIFATTYCELISEGEAED